MYSRMYVNPNELDLYLQNNNEKPMILCEYVHTMANSGGTLHKYIEMMSRHPHYQGGFIWDFIDQSLLKKDRYGNYFQAYGGDFGDRPCDFNFCGNGIVYADRRLSPKMQTVKYNYQQIVAEVKQDKMTVTNKSLFTSTSEFECTIILERNGVEIRRAYLETDVAPLSSAELPLPLAVPEESGEYAITASFALKSDCLWETKGHEVAFGQFVVKIAAPKSEARTSGAAIPAYGTAAQAKDTTCSTPLKVIQSCQTIGVRGEQFSAMFSLVRGGLYSYNYGGREMIKQIPKPNFWRAPIDNDIGSLTHVRSAQWKIASLYASHVPPEQLSSLYIPPAEPRIEIAPDRAVITFVYYLPTSPGAECEVSYTIFGDGTVCVDMSCEPKGLPPMPEFGMMFKLDADYEHLEWYGMGPEENYIDRVTGARLGIYRNKVSDNMAGYLVPQECGNKTGVRYAKLTDSSGRGIVFCGDEMEFSALPYTPHELENAMHAYELPQRHYTVVCANYRQMGIAGDNSWGARIHEEYLLPSDEKLSFSFSFKGV